LADAFTRNWLDQWYGVLVAQDCSYAAVIVTFFSEFNNESFDFFRLVFAPVGGSSADWAK
jgi:hypothetical protein